MVKTFLGGPRIHVSFINVMLGCIFFVLGSTVRSLIQFTSNSDARAGEDVGLHHGYGECKQDFNGVHDRMHILYSSSGSHPGFLSELQASVKSVLINAPLDYPLDIHFLADPEAQSAIADILQSHLSDWRTRQPITIRTYNIDPKVSNRWMEEIINTVKKLGRPDFVSHTRGSYFRLFADKALNSTDASTSASIKNVLYMDSDVVIMSNLGRLWQEVRSANGKRPPHQEYHFMWGAKQCAGFLVINIQKLQDFRERVRKYDLLTLKGETKTAASALEQTRASLNDQFLIRSVQLTEPELIARLPDEWDVSAADGPWKRRWGMGLLRDRPHGVGMLHFNGGGRSKESVFVDHTFLVLEPNDTEFYKNDLESTWKLAHFYDRLDWNWARFMVESQVRSDGGYPISIHHNGRIIPADANSSAHR